LNSQRDGKKKDERSTNNQSISMVNGKFLPSKPYRPNVAKL